MLGVKPLLGRTFRPEEDQLGASPVVLLADGLWKRRFASSPHILGQSLTMYGKAYTIVGCSAGTSPVYKPSDVFVPIGTWDDPGFHDRRMSMGMSVIGRLKPSVELRQAQADMDAIARNLEAAYPEADKGVGIALIPLKETIVGDIRPILLLLLGAVVFVLLIASANIGGLLLARSTARAREFAVRAALGANRTRVIRQLLTESFLVATLGGGIGSFPCSRVHEGDFERTPSGFATRGRDPIGYARAWFHASRFRSYSVSLRFDSGAQNFSDRFARNLQRGRSRTKRVAAPSPRHFRGD